MPTIIRTNGLDVSEYGGVLIRANLYADSIQDIDAILGHLEDVEAYLRGVKERWQAEDETRASAHTR